MDIEFVPVISVWFPSSSLVFLEEGFCLFLCNFCAIHFGEPDNKYHYRQRLPYSNFNHSKSRLSLQAALFFFSRGQYLLSDPYLLIISKSQQSLISKDYISEVIRKAGFHWWAIFIKNAVITLRYDWPPKRGTSVGYIGLAYWHLTSPSNYKYLLCNNKHLCFLCFQQK